MESLSCVRLFATPWTIAYQVPLSMGFPRQEYWSGVPSPSPTSMHMCIYMYLCICILIFPTTNYWKNLEAKTHQLQRTDLTASSLSLINFPITGNQGSLGKWQGLSRPYTRWVWSIMYQKIRHIWLFPLSYMKVAYIMTLYLKILQSVFPKNRNSIWHNHNTVINFKKININATSNLPFEFQFCKLTQWCSLSL